MPYFDLEWNARTNPQFNAELSFYINRIQENERLRKTDIKARKQIGEDLKALLKHCDYNFGFLTPYFFPRYPKDQPLSLTDRPYSFSMFGFQIGGSTTLRASRQIGKSTSLAARQLMFSHVLSGFRSLYITPYTEQLKTYADRLQEMQRAFRFANRQKTYRQNLYYKEYPNGAMIKLAYALTSAASLRGNSADELLFDEYQNFDISLEDEILEIQKASTMPVRVFAGTSLTTDTALEAKYQLSSQGVWMIRCGCGKWLNTGDREVALQLVQPDGVTCPKCSRLVDVRSGHYVHTFQDKLASNDIGFHIPQIIIPYFTEDMVRWSEIYRKKIAGGNINKFLEEVLGIPTEEGAREITQQMLRDMCVLKKSEVQAKAKRGEYLTIVSGCDWGGSDYLPEARTKVSYTVHVMLGVNHDYTIDIIHFQHYAGMDYDSIADDIAANHQALNGEALASDFGVGQVYNTKLRERLQNVHKHLIFGYVGPSSPAVSEPAGPHMLNQYSLNRTESITTLYEAIKNLRIRCYEWDMAERYLMEFLNLFRAPNESAAGVTSFTYRRHGSKADDSLHAVNFSYVLARLILGEPIINDRALRDRILQIIRGGFATEAAAASSGARRGVNVTGRRLRAVSG